MSFKATGDFDLAVSTHGITIVLYCMKIQIWFLVFAVALIAKALFINLPMNNKSSKESQL